MKRAKVLLVAVASMCILSSANVFADGSGWWMGLTISQKKTAIINQALAYPVGSYGGECKYWVQMLVIKPASGNHVMLPQNNPAPYDYYWQTDYSYHVSPQWGRPIEQVERGDIVQMHLKSGYLKSGYPHTIIVLYNNPVSGKITFRESNVPYGTGQVSERTQTYAEFKNAATYYVIYWIM